MNHQLSDQSGESLMSIGLAMVIIVLFSLLSINTFLAGQSNSTNTSTATQAYLLGYTLLQQQTAAGCGTATSSQTLVTSASTIAPNSVAVSSATADTLASIAQKCKYQPEEQSGALVYSAPTKLPSTPTCKAPKTSFLADTPWVCIVYNNVTYQARLQNKWVANSSAPCTTTPTATPPTAKGLERTVSLVWYTRDTYFHQTFSRYFPVPSNSPATNMPDVGGIAIYGLTATEAALGVSMTITYTAVISVKSYRLSQYTNTAQQKYILFPYIPTGKLTTTVEMRLGTAAPMPITLSPHKLLCKKPGTI